MEQFRKFLRDKAFALVLTACLLAAAAAGVWAVRTVRNELKQNLDAVRSPSSTAPGIDEGIRTSPGLAGEEDAEILARLMLAVPKVAEKCGLKDGFRVVITNGLLAGETIPPLPQHILGGRQLHWPPC